MEQLAFGGGGEPLRIGRYGLDDDIAEGIDGNDGFAAQSLLLLTQLCRSTRRVQESLLLLLARMEQQSGEAGGESE